MNLETVANVLGGIVSGGKILCPGFGHSKIDRSLCVTFDPKAPDGFWVHSFAGDNWQVCRDHVKNRLGIGLELRQMKPLVNRPNTPKTNNTPSARKIWQEARAAAGSPVEPYLHGRGLKLVIEAYSCALRYHPACPFEGEADQAMVAAMVNIHTNEFQGIHRTRLDPKDKAMFGPAKGAAVKLTPDEDVTYGLHICEGIETGLALMDMGFKPLWACLSAGGIAKFPILIRVDSLTIFADNDKSQTGQNAALECGARWQSAGKEVRIFATPEAGTDFADWMAA